MLIRYADKMKRKSQVSMEFMIFVGVAVIILALFTVIIIMYINSIYMDKEKIMAGRTVDDIKYEVSVASRVDDGYVRMFKVPESIGGWNYDLYFDKRYVFVRFEEEAEQGDIIAGLSADIENANPPNLLKFEIREGEETNRDLVIEKENNGVYVCTVGDFNKKNSCLQS